MKNWLKKIKLYFIQLSLYKKIVGIFLVSFLCIYMTFSISIHYLITSYEEELFKANSRSLSHVATTIASAMKTVEDISTNLIDDAIIQEQLYRIKISKNSGKQAQARKTVYESLYAYTFFNSYLKSIHFTLPDGTNICMGNSDDILSFDLDFLENKAAHNKGKLAWAPSDGTSNDAVCFRQFNQQKYLTFEKLAGLYIIVDMEKLISDSLSNEGYLAPDSGFVLFEQEHQIYPVAASQEDTFLKIFQSMEHSEEAYRVHTIRDDTSFIIAGTLPHVGWKYLYFTDYSPIFHGVQTVKIQVFFFILSSALLSLWAARRILKDVKTLSDQNYEKQLLLKDTRIKMLQQQIHPHFLYNTLDTINWTAQKYGIKEISTMARSLANLFRASIKDTGDLIPLDEELSFLENYLQIQKIRFRDRLIFQSDIPPGFGQLPIPKLCIQPLVENALKHSMDCNDEICTIRLSLHPLPTQIEIRVSNTGSAFSDDLMEQLKQQPASSDGSGIGLSNINARLTLLYGKEYGLRFYNIEETAVVLLSIPLRKEVANAAFNDCRR